MRGALRIVAAWGPMTLVAILWAWLLMGLLSGCSPIQATVSPQVEASVASPQAASHNATSQPVSNSGAQSGNAGTGEHNWTVNVGAVRVDGLALLAACAVGGLVLLKGGKLVHGNITRKRAKAARSG